MAASRRHLASALGCILDCDLATGLAANGAPATDNTALLNDLLATATAANPVTLILDGPTLTTGIILNGGHTTIEGIGPDSGFFLKSGANAHAIRNHVPMEGDANHAHAEPPPRSNFGISLRNFRINGNRGDGRSGNASHGLPYDTSGLTMLFGISILHTTSIWLEDLILHDATTYAVCLSNCSAIVCRGLRVEAPSNDRNTDGVHINGPASDVLISGCYFQTGDDALALNAPEGFGGAITRVSITDCIFDHAAAALRTYGCALPPLSFPVSNVSLSACTGSLADSALRLGFVRTPPTPTLQSFTVANCLFTAAHWTVVHESCGVLHFSGQTWDSPTLAGYFLWIAAPITLSSVTVTDCRIYRTARGGALASLLQGTDDARGANLHRLAIEGFSIENETGGAYPAVPYLIDTTNLSIDELYLGSLDPANITALVNPTHGFDGIASVSGPGVLAAGFPIPDNVIAENTPYLSASFPHAGQPCIKRQGKVTKL